jgi:hypothetical protein
MAECGTATMLATALGQRARSGALFSCRKFVRLYVLLLKHKITKHFKIRLFLPNTDKLKV